jgi:hypothetical protein
MPVGDDGRFILLLLNQFKSKNAEYGIPPVINIFHVFCVGKFLWLKLNILYGCFPQIDLFIHKGETRFVLSFLFRRYGQILSDLKADRV